MIIYIINFILFFNFVFLSAVVNTDPLHVSQNEKLVHLYSHGFGENGPFGKGTEYTADVEGPAYPDAPGRLDAAVFYTKPAVDVLADHVKQIVTRLPEQEPFLHPLRGKDIQNRLLVEGRSCGAGTFINFLARLYAGEHDSVEKETMTKIDAAFKGFILDVPFLDVKRVASLCYAAKVVAIGIAAGSCKLLNLVLKKYSTTVDTGKTTDTAKKLAAYCMVLPLTYFVAHKAFMHSTTRLIFPWFTGYHFDPTYPTPLENLEKIRGKIKVPVLLHFCKDDGTLINEKDDILKTYRAFRAGNEKQTFIVLTEPGEGSHNQLSDRWKVARKAFINAVKQNQSFDELKQYCISPEEDRKSVV